MINNLIVKRFVPEYDRTMESYVIEGGTPLEGQITISGNKNGALAAMTAALLSDERVILRNIPLIEDIKVLSELLRSINVDVKLHDDHTCEIDSFGCDWSSISLSPSLVESIRASLLLVGPLLTRAKSLVLPPPGGDVIGFRRIDTLIDALELFSASCHVNDDGYLIVQSDELVGNRIFLNEASVTTTENVIMIASMARGSTTIVHAACEPHVQDLCRMLNCMGAKISGIGSNVLSVEGVEKLHGCDFSIGPDYMEIGSFIGLAGATASEIELKNVSRDDLMVIEQGYRKIGLSWKASGPDSIIIPKNQKRIISKSVSGFTNKIDDAPWPGFPADLLSIITVAATQMNGTILVHEKMYESRMFFIDWLIRMGADIILCDPHRAVIQGPNILKPAIVSSPDVRAGMALVIATLCAEGTSIIQNIYQIERGYEDLTGKLLQIGAKIKRES